MSRISMAVASTLVVLAALGLAHFLAFQITGGKVEAAPPAAFLAEAAANAAPAEPKPLYQKARTQLHVQARGVAPSIRRAAEGAIDATCAATDRFPETNDQSAGRGGAVACEFGAAGETCFELTFTGPVCPLTFKVFRGLTVEDACGCEEACCPAGASQSKRCLSEEAKKIDDFAATDEFPLGRIWTEFGAWLGAAPCESCPACRCPGDCPDCCLARCSEGCPATKPAAEVAATKNCPHAKKVRTDNCPGAEMEGRPLASGAKEDSRDRELAEQIGQIEEIRRERESPLQGSLLEGSDENEATDFGEALRLVAGFSQLIEGETPTPPGPVPPLKDGPAYPNFGNAEEAAMPSVSDPLLVDVLRHASRLLDLRSHDLEDNGRYEEADHLRALANTIRAEARKSCSPPTSEGGCGLFCPAAAAKAMCAPSIEKTARRPAPVTKDGPVGRH